MLFRSLCSIYIIFAMCALNRAQNCNLEGEERKVDIGLTNDVIQVCFNNGSYLQWTYVCSNSFGATNIDIFCKRFGYIGLGYEFVNTTPRLFNGTVKLKNLDCIGNETSLTDCTYSTTKDKCRLVSYVSCEECQNKYDCRTLAVCMKRSVSSSFKSCLCIDECMNGGFCFDEMCVCPPAYTGPSCETNIPTTPQQQTTTTQITESITTTTSRQTINTNSTQTNTESTQIEETTKSQIPEYSKTHTSFSIQPTHSPTTNTIGFTIIKSNTNIPQNSQQTQSVTKTATILSSKIPDTNHQNFPTTTNITNTDFPTKLPGQKCPFGRRCRETKDRTTIRIIYSTVSAIVLLLIALVILCLVCCICRLYCKVKKYRNLSVKRQITENRSCIITNLTNREQMSGPTSIELLPYYTRIMDEIDDRERSFESTFGQETLHYPLHVEREMGESSVRDIIVCDRSLIQSNGTYYEDLSAFHNNNFTTSNQGTNDSDEITLSIPDEINFYHTLVNNQTADTNDDTILNKIIRDRQMGEFDYIEPPYNLNELSNCIGHVSSEIPMNKLRIGDVFATGNFGVVCRAVYTTKYGDSPVAIKTLREEANNDLKIAFIREAAILAQFNHPNILKFVGIVTTVEPNMIVTELLSIELRQFLIQLNSVKGTSYHSKCKLHILQVKFCREIAEGMEHLALKKFIHRDLAARNILIANDMSCRIADFGMSRDLKSNDYYKSKGGRIPLRWTAPEALLYNRYSEKSDVWAYGMTLYEIWTLGCKPWQENTNEEIIGFIEGGEIPLQPTGCPNDVYNVMMHSWRQTAADRPKFSEIKYLISTVMLSPCCTESVSI